MVGCTRRLFGSPKRKSASVSEYLSCSVNEEYVSDTESGRERRGARERARERESGASESARTREREREREPTRIYFCVRVLRFLRDLSFLHEHFGCDDDRG